ncbi:MAG: DUF2283 domain-containing protein [Pseudomonadota bacterium]
MDITYNDKEDILFINFNHEKIVKDISYGWNVNVGLTDKGIGQITVLDAKAAHLLPVHISPEIAA